MITLLVLLSIKHFLADFAYQPPYQWQNKGTWGHLGGIVHSGQHAALTFIILLFFINPAIAAALAICEFIVHYHIDWAKMNINKYFGWGATTHNQFWVLTGFDQLLHTLTYLAIAAYVF
jgi:hypothetical protein